MKIPQDRIGVLIGAGGETLREIEDRAEVRLDVDSEEGSVRIERVAAERLQGGGFSFAATIPAALARDLSPDSDVLSSFRDIVSSGGSVRLVEEVVEYNLAIADDAVVLWLCDDEGIDQGVLVTDDGRVHDWADRRIRRHDDAAVPFEETRVPPSEG